MLELYLAIILLSGGFYLSNQHKNNNIYEAKTIQNTKNIKDTKETFVGNNYYSVQNARELESRAAVKRNKEGYHVVKGFTKPAEENKPNVNAVVSALTGETLTKDTFKTRSDGTVFEPFFGENITQNTRNLEMPNRLLELNGISEYTFKKKETGQFFPPTANLSFVNGTPVRDESFKERYNESKIRDNELPFEQIKVGPGIGQDYGTEGTGGFQQLDLNEIMRPKNVDELRTADNPKLTYKGRTITGSRYVKNRGKQSEVFKNRPETFYKNSPERYLKTMGDLVKPKADEHFIVNRTNRQKSRSFMGNAKKDISGPEQSSEVKKSTRNIYRNATLGTQYNKRGSDMILSNKNSIENKPNERDITQKRNHTSNLITVVKSIITPFQDKAKQSKKENFEKNSRPDGNMSASIPKKMTVYDSNDIAKTTIKETTIHNYRKGNFNGPDKITVYDPNDIARTTIKETTIHNNRKGNFDGPKKLITYDPNDIARTTIKETTIHNTKEGMAIPQQPNKPQLNTTDKPKVTIRNTLDNVSNNLNINPGGPKKLQTFNKNNPPKTTVKETTVEEVRAGHIQIAGDDAYLVAPADAPNTNRQFLTDFEYQGVAECNAGGTGIGNAYLTTEVDAPNTSKQFLSNNDYTGSASSYLKAQINDEASKNMLTNISKEQISKGRKPTQNNVKVVNGSINTINKKQMSGVSLPKVGEGPKHIETSTNEQTIPHLSHRKDQLNNSQQTERINPEILDALKENPFAKSVTDTGPQFLLNTEESIESKMDRLEKQRTEQDELNRRIQEEIDKLE